MLFHARKDHTMHATLVHGPHVPAPIHAEMESFRAHCFRPLPNNPTQQGLYLPAVQSYPFPIGIFRVYGGTMMFVLTESGGVLLLDQGLPVQAWGAMALLAPDPFHLALSAAGFHPADMNGMPFSDTYGDAYEVSYSNDPQFLGHIRMHCPPACIFVNPLACARFPDGVTHDQYGASLIKSAFDRWNHQAHAHYPPLGSDYDACYDRNWTDTQQQDIGQDLHDLMTCLGQSGSVTLTSSFDHHPMSWGNSNYDDPTASFVRSETFVRMLHTYIGYGPYDLRAHTFGFNGDNINHADSYTRTGALIVYRQVSTTSSHQRLSALQNVHAKLHTLGIEPGPFLEKAAQELMCPSPPHTPLTVLPSPHQRSRAQRFWDRIRRL